MPKYWYLLAAVLLFSSAATQASEAKEEAASPYAKMETFTVNLKNLTQYLQVTMALKLADPKTAESIKNWSPVIRHELILLLSSQNGEDLATLAGKRKVMEAVKTAVNKVLNLDTKDGVTDVLLESFVIQ